MGTIVFGDEAGGGPNDGRVYEIIDPLHTSNVHLDRATGTFSGDQGAQNLATAKRRSQLMQVGVPRVSAPHT